MGLDELFAQWQEAGIFAYALPFLLIFALVFGLLTKINIFKSGNEPNKPVNAIISLAVALMALQFNLVSNFFANIFPRFGVALAILLVILILLGFFTDIGDKNLKWFLYAVVLISVIAVLWGPLGDLGFNINLNGWLVENIGWIIFVIIMVGLLGWALSGGKKGSSGKSGSSE